MKIGSYLSNKISITMFFAISLVVLRHSINIHIYFPGIYSIGFLDINSFIQIFINSLTNIAIPFFFIISGYLFFFKFELKNTFLKWKKRFSSLFIPYIIWNVLLILFFLVIQEWDWTTNFSNYDKIELKFNSLLYLTFLKPALGQFWYIRDLMIFVISAPLFYFIYKNERLSLLFLLLLVFLWRPVDTNICSSEGLLFFNIGGYLGYRKSNLINKDLKRSILYLFFCFFICLKIILVIHLINNQHLISIVEKIAILIGLLFFWNFADILISKLNITKILKISSYSFFIYAFHSPLIKIFYKVLLSALPRSQLTGVIVYLVSPVFLILLSITVAQALILTVPWFYNILIGDRLSRN